MNGKRLKTLGILFAVLTVASIAVGFKLRSELKSHFDQQAENTRMLLEGRPMGGRMQTPAEANALRNKETCSMISFSLGVLFLGATVICFRQAAGMSGD